jgi:hypothetical protein
MLAQVCAVPGTDDFASLYGVTSCTRDEIRGLYEGMVSTVVEGGATNEPPISARTDVVASTPERSIEANGDEIVRTTYGNVFNLIDDLLGRHRPPGDPPLVAKDLPCALTASASRLLDEPRHGTRGAQLSRSHLL